LSSWPDISCMAISKKMRRTGHVTLMGECRNAKWVLVFKSEGKTPLEDLEIERRIIVKLILTETEWEDMD